MPYLINRLITWIIPSSSLERVIKSAESFDDRLGVSHGDSQPRVLDHGKIVVSVPAADHLVRGQPDAVQQLLQRFCLVDIAGHDLQEERLGTVDVQQTVVLRLQRLP